MRRSTYSSKTSEYTSKCITQTSRRQLIGYSEPSAYFANIRVKSSHPTGRISLPDRPRVPAIRRVISVISVTPARGPASTAVTKSHNNRRPDAQVRPATAYPASNNRWISARRARNTSAAYLGGPPGQDLHIPLPRGHTGAPPLPAGHLHCVHPAGRRLVAPPSVCGRISG